MVYIKSNNIYINEHSSIKIIDKKVIYFDPFRIKESKHDADLIFITHSHFDHYSKEDIGKILNKNTILIFPLSMKNEVNDIYENIVYFDVDEEKNIEGYKVKAVPSYNVNKPMHPKENKWLGYIIEINNQQIYVCGDVEDDLIDDFADFNLTFADALKLDLSYLRNFNQLETKAYESSFLQSAISIIYHCDVLYNDELYFALKVFIEMLNYQLFKIIREEYNYCYYIYALSNNYLNTFEIVSEIESKNLDKVVELVQSIIDSYTISFNVEQFNLCKNKILNSIKTSLDSPRDTIDLHFGFNFIKTITSISDLENAYNSVSIEQVKKVSKMCTLKLISILKEVNNNG